MEKPTFWERLRTVFDLARRVHECERTVADLQQEWTDVLDKLLAREDRLRKRYRHQLNETLEPTPATTSPADVKTELRRRLGALKAGGSL